MVAAYTVGMSLRIFSTSVFALSAASVNNGGGSNELIGADSTTNRKMYIRVTTGRRKKKFCFWRENTWQEQVKSSTITKIILFN